MVQEHVTGSIKDITEDGRAIIHAALPNLKHALDRRYSEVEIILPDGRSITGKQRRKVFAIIGEIAEYVEGIRNAQTVEETKELMKMEFMLSRMESQERKLFSLANVDETTASCFIDFLIEFCVQNNIPMSISPLEYCEDIGKYIYACLVNKKCAICGKPADLHHVQSVGSQGYREKINHIGLEALPLCREHHTESHKIGQTDFIEKYHLQPVKIDDKIAKIYRLKEKENNNE
jgi:hypothetical protein